MSVICTQIVSRVPDVHVAPSARAQTPHTHRYGHFIIMEDESGVNTGELGYRCHCSFSRLRFQTWMPKFDGASRRIQRP